MIVYVYFAALCIAVVSGGDGLNPFRGYDLADLLREGGRMLLGLKDTPSLYCQDRGADGIIDTCFTASGEQFDPSDAVSSLLGAACARMSRATTTSPPRPFWWQTASTTTTTAATKRSTAKRVQFLHNDEGSAEDDDDGMDWALGSLVSLVVVLLLVLVVTCRRGPVEGCNAPDPLRRFAHRVATPGRMASAALFRRGGGGGSGGGNGSSPECIGDLEAGGYGSDASSGVGANNRYQPENGASLFETPGGPEVRTSTAAKKAPASSTFTVANEAKPPPPPPPSSRKKKSKGEKSKGGDDTAVEELRNDLSALNVHSGEE